jgi:CoA:oxalate CoA-transferase
MPEGALGDLKVLDLTHYIAGPYCTKLLGGLGATVVKVERPNTGDALRQVGPFYEDVPGPDRGFPFLYLNTDKQSVTLNLKTDTGVKMFKRLAEWADIVIESYRPGVMDDFGLSYEELEKVNPNLIMVSISNFGQTGPYRDYAMTDLTSQALGGLMIMVGEPEREPLQLGAYQALCSAAVAAFTGTMTAVMARNLRGIGQHVDVSITEMVAYTEWHATSAYAFNQTSRKRRGRLTANKVLRTKDGHMGAWTQWPSIKRLVGGALEDEKFDTLAGREEHTHEYGDAVEAWLLTRNKLDAYHEGQAAGQPWGYIATMKDLMESEQYQARSFLKEMAHPTIGKGTYATVPFRIGSVPGGPWQPAPRLGEHNPQVYGSVLGYDSADLIRLHEVGVI